MSVCPLFGEGSLSGRIHTAPGPVEGSRRPDARALPARLPTFRLPDRLHRHQALASTRRQPGCGDVAVGGLVDSTDAMNPPEAIRRAEFGVSAVQTGESTAGVFIILGGSGLGS